MSYAIIRNEKLTRAQAMGAYKHNERKTKNHSNKNIDSSKTELNYYLKKTELSYIKEFDRIKEKYDLKGQIRSNSNIIYMQLQKFRWAKYNISSSTYGWRYTSYALVIYSSSSYNR